MDGEPWRARARQARHPVRAGRASSSAGAGARRGCVAAGREAASRSPAGTQRQLDRPVCLDRGAPRLRNYRQRRGVRASRSGGAHAWRRAGARRAGGRPAARAPARCARRQSTSAHRAAPSPRSPPGAATRAARSSRASSTCGSPRARLSARPASGGGRSALRSPRAQRGAPASAAPLPGAASPKSGTQPLPLSSTMELSMHRRPCKTCTPRATRPRHSYISPCPHPLSACSTPGARAARRAPVDEHRVSHLLRRPGAHLARLQHARHWAHLRANEMLTELDPPSGLRPAQWSRPRRATCARARSPGGGRARTVTEMVTLSRKSTSSATILCAAARRPRQPEPAPARRCGRASGGWAHAAHHAGPPSPQACLQQDAQARLVAPAARLARVGRQRRGGRVALRPPRLDDRHRLPAHRDRVLELVRQQPVRQPRVALRARAALSRPPTRASMSQSCAARADAQQATSLSLARLAPAPSTPIRRTQSAPGAAAGGGQARRGVLGRERGRARPRSCGSRRRQAPVQWARLSRRSAPWRPRAQRARR